MPSFHGSMVSGNTAFTFWQGLQKAGESGRDIAAIWWQSHRFLWYFPFPDVLVLRLPPGLADFFSDGVMMTVG